jgi:hypothetical protein
VKRHDGGSMTYYVSGRSLENWRAKGQNPPADAVHMPCGICRESITLSPEGAAKLIDATARGCQGAALCTRCSMVAVATHNGGVEIGMSDYCARQVAGSADAKATLDALLTLAGKDKPA